MSPHIYKSYNENNFLSELVTFKSKKILFGGLSTRCYINVIFQVIV